MLSILTRRCGVELRNSIATLQKRTFILGKKLGEKKYRKKDGMDESWTMIYKAPMEYYLAACNHITTLSALLFGAYCVNEYINRHEEKDPTPKPFSITSDKTMISETDFKYFGAAFVGINVILRITLYRYPLRIYMNGNKYTAIFEGQLPFRKEKYEFIRGAVKEMPAKGILPWSDSRFLINNERKVIMLYESFRTPSYLFEMMKVKPKPKRYLEDEFNL